MVFIPLIRMFSYMDAESIKRVVTSPNFGDAVVNSIVSAVLGTLITVIIAFFLALCIKRTNIRLKGIFAIIFVFLQIILFSRDLLNKGSMKRQETSAK